VNQADLDAVVAANDEFYGAFEAQDIDRMAACWSQDEAARCIHPGTDVIVGWPRISRSWTAIFVNSTVMQFFLTEVEVHAGGDVAVVTCAENILSGEDLAAGKVLATNVFRRIDGHWRMILHHGSPVMRP
jgi:ketosteroid isomerase-like protein